MRGTTRSIIGAIILLLAVFLIIKYAPQDTVVDDNASFVEKPQGGMGQNVVANPNAGIRLDMIPPEDLEICNELKLDDPCAVITPRGERKGLCKLVQ